ncbi:MAG: mechanosensitive ion channel domain-containing protein [Ginsengibacter sp.]|jgi:small-conductance mechanosensitive channel
MEQQNTYERNIFPADKPKNRTYRVGGYAVLAFVALAIHFLIELKVFSILDDYLTLIKKLSLSIFFIFLVLAAGKFIEKLISDGSGTTGNRYNLIRITRLLTTLFILILAISFFSQNLYAAAVSFGLISLIFGFALQAPISSFIGWLYIVFRSPYQVGDRIQIGQFKGDVIEISYLDTIILEFSGDYLNNDRSSGRVIHFPNSQVLRTEVFNYSGPSYPFIWNETAIQIAYNSDVDFVEECLLDAADRDFYKRYPDFNHEPMPHWKPDVYFRVNTYAWLEAVVSYPVKPMDTTARRTEILKFALQKMNAQPSKALFPQGADR